MMFAVRHDPNSVMRASSGFCDLVKSPMISLRSEAFEGKREERSFIPVKTIHPNTTQQNPQDIKRKACRDSVLNHIRSESKG